jgi:hypothetical protein
MPDFSLLDGIPMNGFDFPSWEVSDPAHVMYPNRASMADEVMSWFRCISKPLTR